MPSIFNPALHGAPGTPTQQTDNIIEHRANAETTAAIEYGTPVTLTGNGVKKWSSTANYATFAGIAVNNPGKTPTTYGSSTGSYAPGEIVDVMVRGHIIVTLSTGTCAAGGSVYVVKLTGAFAAEADGSNTVELTNCKFCGPKDANNRVEILLNQRNLL